MANSFGRQILLSGVRKWQMSRVMAESRCANYAPPVSPFVLASTRNEVSNTVVTDVFRICNHVINTASQIHYAERVLESAVRGRRIDKIGQGKLVNISQTLKGP